MDPVPPRIVIEPEDGEKRSPPPDSPHLSPHTRGGESGGSAFAKLVQTVQFIKKWAGRAEKPPDQREQFLERFKMAAPNIDDAYAHHNEGGRENGGGVSVRRSRQLVFFFNPSGNWLYRWLVVITFAVLYNAFMIIVRETFDQLQSDNLTLWLVLDSVADIVYIADMVVQFRTSECFNSLRVCIYYKGGGGGAIGIWYSLEPVGVSGAIPK